MARCMANTTNRPQKQPCFDLQGPREEWDLKVAGVHAAFAAATTVVGGSGVVGVKEEGVHGACTPPKGRQLSLQTQAE
eukprot:1161840-Pelagomonas_calceolata.AAC.10